MDLDLILTPVITLFQKMDLEARLCPCDHAAPLNGLGSCTWQWIELGQTPKRLIRTSCVTGDNEAPLWRTAETLCEPLDQMSEKLLVLGDYLISELHLGGLSLVPIKSFTR